MTRLRRELRKAATAHEDLADSAADLAVRLAPAPGEPAGSLADALEPPATAATGPAPAPAAAAAAGTAGTP